MKAGSRILQPSQHHPSPTCQSSTIIVKEETADVLPA
jgi:hypothetical protein